MEEDYFDIKFQFDGVEYEGQVWPDYDSQENALFQVTYHPVDQPHKSGVIFIEDSDVGTWVQLKEDGIVDRPSGGFLEAIGKEIELHDA